MLPNLGIGVVSVLALAFVTKLFVEYLERQEKAHGNALLERENALRELEREVRNNIMGQLSKNTQAFERVLDHFNRPH